MKTIMKGVRPLSRAGMLSGLLIVAVSLMLVAVPTFAGSKGRKNTAIGLSAATAYELLKGQTKTGIVLGVGSAVAWKQYEVARNREKSASRSSAASSSSRVKSYNSGTITHPIYRAGTSGSGANATQRASSGVATAAVTEKVAALKQHAAIRQAAMQQNLDELALQTQKLNQKNQLQNAQMASLQIQNAQSRVAVTRYFRWAMLTSALAVLALGGLFYALVKPGQQRGGPKVAKVPAA